VHLVRAESGKLGAEIEKCLLEALNKAHELHQRLQRAVLVLLLTESILALVDAHWHGSAV